MIWAVAGISARRVPVGSLQRLPRKEIGEGDKALPGCVPGINAAVVVPLSPAVLFPQCLEVPVHVQTHKKEWAPNP